MADQWTDRLSEYLDGELAPFERQALDAHLAACADCAGVLEELDAVRQQASVLPERVPPVADPWAAIASRIERMPRSGADEGRAPRRVSLPQLAAAAALVLAVGMGSMWMRQPPRGPGVERDPAPADYGQGVHPVALADESFDAAVADLEAVLDEGRGRLNAETIRVLEENLAAIDAAVVQAREALAADPANVGLTNHLLRTRAMRLGLLRRAVAATQTAG